MSTKRTTRRPATASPPAAPPSAAPPPVTDPPPGGIPREMVDRLAASAAAELKGRLKGLLEVCTDALADVAAGRPVSSLGVVQGQGPLVDVACARYALALRMREGRIA